jgi:hypothetical protein
MGIVSQLVLVVVANVIQRPKYPIRQAITRAPGRLAAAHGRLIEDAYKDEL